MVVTHFGSKIGKHLQLCGRAGVKECGTKRAHNFLFHNTENYSLGDVQGFCYRS
jgi:hypothetical protein